MADPVRPFESGSELDESRSAGPVPLPSSNFPSETATRPGPHIVTPEEAQRTGPPAHAQRIVSPAQATRIVNPAPRNPDAARANTALLGTAERVGSAVGVAVDSVNKSVAVAVDRVRELPRRLEEMKQRFTVVRGRTSEDAKAAAAEWKQTAQERLEVARTRAQHYAHEYPLHVIAGAGAAAFALGFMLRIWRGNHARR